MMVYDNNLPAHAASRAIDSQIPRDWPASRTIRWNGSFVSWRRYSIVRIDQRQVVCAARQSAMIDITPETPKEPTDLQLTITESSQPTHGYSKLVQMHSRCAWHCEQRIRSRGYKPLEVPSLPVDSCQIKIKSTQKGLNRKIKRRGTPIVSQPPLSYHRL